MQVGINATKIYFYYGNESTRNKSNGNDTFEFFDDFENVSKSESQWSPYNQGGGAVDEWTIANGYAQLKNGAGTAAVSLVDFAVLDDFIVEVKIMHIGFPGNSMGLVSRADNSSFHLYRFSDWNYNDLGSVSASVVVDTWYTTYLSNIGTTISAYTYSQNVSYSAVDANLASGKAGVQVYSQTARFDDFRIRKVVSLMPSVSVSASEELSPAPVEYWGFDEGYGVTAYDASGEGNNGIISGATWKGEGNCVIGKCLELDGSDDYIDIGVDDSMNFSANQGITVNVWFRTSEDYGTIFSLRHSSTHTPVFDITVGYDGVGIEVGKLMGLFRGDGGSYIRTSGDLVNDGSWHLATLVRQVDGRIELFKDGVSQGVSSSVSATSLNTDIRAVGSERRWVQDGFATADKNNLNGDVDEAKIYPYARTAGQIKQDYNAGLAGASTKKGTNVSFGGESDKWMSDGLVGYWKMDEADTSGGAVDSSGNGNDGTSYDTSDVTVGKFGNSYVGGGGSTDYMRTSTNNNLDNLDALTISFWANLTGNYYSMALIAKGTYYSGSNGLQLVTDESTNSGVLMFRRHYSGATLDVRTEGGFLERDSWNLYTITTDGTDFADGVHIYKNGEEIAYGLKSDATGTRDSDAGYDFTIGDTSNGDIWNYDGKMDEVRVYNRELSSDEVKKLYEYAPGPVAHWKFDEMSGSNAYDFSENGNNETLTNEPTWNPVGKYSSALELDGVDDYVDMGVINSNLHSVGMWIYLENELTGSSACQELVKYSDYNDDNDQDSIVLGSCSSTVSDETVMIMGYDSGSKRTYIKDNLSSGWHYLGMVWNENISQYDILINEVKKTVYNYNGGVQVSAIDDFELANGGDSVSFDFFDGQIDDVRIYNYARTQEQILEDMNGGKSATKSPVLHLKLDEGNGTVASDASASGNDGTLTNSPTWLQNGVFGKALNFDGLNDYIAMGDISAVELSTSFAVSFWARTKENVNKVVLEKDQNNGFSVQTLVGGRMEMNVGGSSAALECSAVNNDGNWHHHVFAYGGVGDGKAYLDGEDKTSANPSVLTPSYSSGALTVAGRSASYNFTGDLDEIKIYNFEPSLEDIKNEYQNGIKGIEISGGNVFSMGGSSESAISRRLEDGLLGYWKMDEASWSGVAGEVIDSSGNGNDGTTTGNANTTTGRFGRAGDFDAIDDSVNTGMSMSGDFTVSAWVISNGGSFQYIMSDTASKWFWSLSWGGFYNGTDWTTPVSTGVYDGKWHMVSCTGNGEYIRCYIDGRIVSTDEGANPDTTTAVQIGRRSNAYHFDGKIDEARVYNRALSGNEIRELYLKSADPILHLKMDEMTGTSAYDSSGNNLTGILTNGPTWNPVGKIGSALSFDGATNYVIVPDNSLLEPKNSMTISVWMKADNAQAGATPVQIAGKYSYQLNYDHSNPNFQGAFGIHNGGGWLHSDGPLIISSGEWHQFVGVYDGTYLKTYLDGTEKLSNNVGAVTIAIGNSWFMAGANPMDLDGGTPSSYFAGLVDDVKVYDYTLSSREIAYDFNGGKPLAHWKMDKGEGLLFMTGALEK